MGALKLVEIRAYKLRPGAAAAFHEVFERQGLPLVAAAGMDVVAYGPSAQDPDAYFLIRAFDGLEQRHAAQEAFYASEAWRRGPREAVISRIELYTDTVLWLSALGVDELRKSGVAGDASARRS